MKRKRGSKLVNGHPEVAETRNDATLLSAISIGLAAKVKAAIKTGSREDLSQTYITVMKEKANHPYSIPGNNWNWHQSSQQGSSFPRQYMLEMKKRSAEDMQLINRTRRPQDAGNGRRTDEVFRSEDGGSFDEMRGQDQSTRSRRRGKNGTVDDWIVHSCRNRTSCRQYRR